MKRAGSPLLSKQPVLASVAPPGYFVSFLSSSCRWSPTYLLALNLRICLLLQKLVTCVLSFTVAFIRKRVSPALTNQLLQSKLRLLTPLLPARLSVRPHVFRPEPKLKRVPSKAEAKTTRTSEVKTVVVFHTNSSIFLTSYYNKNCLKIHTLL